MSAKALRSSAVLGLLLLSILPTFAQDFSGTYEGSMEGGHLTLSVTKLPEGEYQGTLSDEAVSMSVAGTVVERVLKGTVTSDWEEIPFEARFEGAELMFTLISSDVEGPPSPEENETIIFRKIEGEQASTSSEPGKTMINGVELTESQIAELEKSYGVVGYPAFGFMLPGHQFGQLSRNASNGNTGVTVNGRELPPLELTVWSYMVGSWIQPGSYWLDHDGNAGYDGNPIPAVNLYAMAQQNGYRGQGSGGDNFWSTRFSAGNYDSDNQRGYVSVPGYGPVGYGF